MGVMKRMAGSTTSKANMDAVIALFATFVPHDHEPPAPSPAEDVPPIRARKPRNPKEKA